MLSAKNLTLIRGERCLFEDLEFTVDRGEMLLLEGPNGSGKTSLLRVIVGLLSLESGEVLWNDVPTLNQRQNFHGALVWLSHRSGLKRDLSTVENFLFEQSLRPQSNLDREEVYQQLGVAKLKRLPLRSLSAGQQRRVALARMLLADVPLWLMDEPFTNLDEDGRQLVMRLTENHVSGGGLCVMAAHQDVDINVTVRRLNLG